MRHSFIERRGYIWSLLKQGLIGPVLGAIYAIVSAFALYRDEVWHPKDAEKYRVYKMIPHLTLSWWLVGVLVILVVWLFESSFRHTHEIQVENKQLNRVANDTSAEESKLELSFVPGMSILANHRFTGRLMAAYSIAVFNNSSFKITECEIRWDAYRVGEVTRRSFYIPSSKEFALRPKEPKEMEVIRVPYEGADSDKNYAEPVTYWDGMFTYEGGGAQPILAPGLYRFVARVYSAETTPAEISLKVSCDDGKWSVSSWD